tara:strand:- start:97 stop:918 length:822 start_codon:yes stop_codon:yes gene_type:complete
MFVKYTLFSEYMIENFQNTGLIGHTGFVGSNLKLLNNFLKCYNSENINDAYKEHFDLLILAGLSGTKFLINKDPREDLKNIENQKNILKSIKANHIVFISTIDIYSDKIGVDENCKTELSSLDHYGLNRLEFEGFIVDNFKKHYIIRLPMLFGKGLKKNILFDLLNNQFLEKINIYSVLQWYDLTNLWKDIKIIIKENIKLINLISEPVTMQDIIRNHFDEKLFNKGKNSGRIQTNILSKFGSCFDSDSDYIYSKEEICDCIDKFILSQPSGP